MKILSRQAARLFSLSAAIVALPGCAIMHAQSRIDPRTVAIYGSKESAALVDEKRCFFDGIPEDANQGAVNLDCAKFPGARDDDPTAYRLAAEEDKDVEAQAKGDRAYYRNRLAALLMKHADDACVASMGRASNNEAFSNVFLNFLTTATSAAATVVSGETAKSILSASAATASGTRDHINAGVFRNTVVSAVGRAISGEKARLGTQIELQLGKTSIEYDVDMMIRDVNRYHQACSFIRGLELVVQSVDRSAVRQADRVKALDDAIAVLRREMAATPALATSLAGQLQQLVSLRAQAAANPDMPVTAPAASAPAAAAAAKPPSAS